MMPSSSETGLMWPTEALTPPQGDVIPPHGAVMGSGVAGDAELCVVGDALVPLPRAFLCRRAKSDVSWTLRTSYAAVAALEGEG